MSPEENCVARRAHAGVEAVKRTTNRQTPTPSDTPHTEGPLARSPCRAGPGLLPFLDSSPTVPSLQNCVTPESDRPRRPWHPETLAIRTQTARGAEREHSTPLFLTSSFVFDDAEQARALFAEEEHGNVYSRYSNPNTDEFVRKMALLEGAEDGIAFASGMAAVFGSMAAYLRSGDHVVASRALFGSTHQLFTKLFPRWGITSSYVDADATPEMWADAVQPSTKMLFVETPSNPGLALIDLEMLGQLASERGLLFVVDNCFTTPILQQPIRWGAHLVEIGRASCRERV